ncbi:MMPL family transporter [Halorubellus sp. JP-L1]|uniref:MMPL family transporter n=1 Tax=Halorubellus sp. JP-L1 TaxID=2715753 RepID=UPI00140886C4|nr:MMPL family transporter [Halorubellus sp. JP-L1]NHN41053.1 MMPL family transporter [Halorubellus sp. JP-L1]
MDRVSDGIADHTKVVIVALLLVTAGLGSQAAAVESDSGLGQFESTNDAANASEYIDETFVADNTSTTSVQVIVRNQSQNGNVLTRESLLASLRYQQELRSNESINRTLAADRGLFGVSNLVAITAIQQEKAGDLRERGAELEARSDSLNESREELEARGEALNETGRLLKDALDTLAEDPNASVRAQFEQVEANSSVELDDEDYATFERAATAVRENRSAIRPTVEDGTERVLANETEAIQERKVALNETAGLLRGALDTLREDSSADVRTQFEQVNANSSVDLDEEDYATFEDAAEQLRSATSREEAEEAYRQGTEGVIEDEAAALEDRAAALNETAPKVGEALSAIASNPNASAREQFEELNANTSVDLGDAEWRAFNATAGDIRAIQADVEASYRLGTQGVIEDESAALEERAEELEAEGEALQEDFEAFQERQSELQSSGTPSLDAQLEHVESMNESQVENVTETVLSNGDGAFAGQALGLMPQDFEPGSTRAEARMLVATLETGSDSQVSNSQTVGESVTAVQLEMQDVAQSDSTGAGDGEEYVVFGFGVISQEISQSLTDSVNIVAPMALLFVVLTLLVAYRDLLDIVLGLFGIVAVLLWTFGFMGLQGISFNQIMIAVPVLLIGLSIDYAIHIFMRHREARTDDDTVDDVRGSMGVALGGVGLALTWVTATTVIGFLSNLTSPLPPIQDFGVVSSVGILAALAVFGALVPALKIEADEFLENRIGLDRRKRAFGTGGGRFSTVLSAGAVAARKAPTVVIAIALVVSIAGGVGATQVSTEFSQESFIADEPAEWLYQLPEPFKPGEYSAKQNLDYVNENFQREDSQAQVLVQANDSRSLDSPAVMTRLNETETGLDGMTTAFRGSSGDVATRTPLSVMRDTAARNESFNETFHAADTDGDGVPDENVTGVLSALFRVNEDEASQYVHRVETDDGYRYEAMQLVVPIEGGADTGEVTTQLQAVAATMNGDGARATATGSPVVNEIVQQELLDTVIQSLVITLVAVFAFLMIAYRIQEGSATLGAFTLLPVALSVSWILGTMYAIGMPFNVLTGMITSLTVGLGVAYSIHVSERFNLELERTGNVWEAMDRTITGTGGALLGSAATTVGGFGTLAFAIFPALQQFGVITGMTIVYAFLASVLVLPSLLVVWVKYFGPEADFAVPSTRAEAPAGGDD